MNNRALRDNPEPVPFEPVGYLDKSGIDDGFLLAYLYEVFNAGISYKKIAEKLHEMKYATSRLHRMKITESNVSKFLSMRMGLRRHAEHEKPNYKLQNVSIHKGLKAKGIQDKTQKAKNMTKNYKQKMGVMLAQNVAGRKTLTAKEKDELDSRLADLGIAAKYFMDVKYE